jgi:DNA-binding GntR family transcriptional regulator
MQVDKEIHLALARIAGNPLHHFFLETVHSNLHRYHISAYLPRDEQTIQATLAELRGIVAAVSRGDAERAEALAREHVQRATTVMQQRSAGGGRALPAVRVPVKRRAPSSRMRKPGTGVHP